MSHPLFDIGGRTALVTGSGRGIGLALARGLLEAACTVVLDGRDAGRLTKAAARLSGDVRTAAFDVTDANSVAAGIADVEERVDPLDTLVDKAGVQLRTPLLEFGDADWHRILDTDLTGAFLVGRAAARRMTERGHGRTIDFLPRVLPKKLATCVFAGPSGASLRLRRCHRSSLVVVGHC
jgi:gluconate 5-dehydrogenase